MNKSVVKIEIKVKDKLNLLSYKIELRDKLVIY